MLFHFLILTLLQSVDTYGPPMYTYIRELCPPSLQPLTGVRHVRTCEGKCPRGSTCIQGICCMRQPSCNHFTYRYSSHYSCIPRVKQNCPDGYKCVPSTQEGMHICCSAKPPRVARVPPEQAVCPTTHPVISSDRQHLRLCSDCQNGVCTPFRSSDISVCCHSSSAFCGPGSKVEMDGLLSRDCSKIPCSEGYECSLAPSGARVCCSLAECQNGQRARAICAAGCRNDENCETIHGQRWCCPAARKKCPDGRVSGGPCSSLSPSCESGFECIESKARNDQYLCCNVPARETKTDVNLVKARVFATMPPLKALTPIALFTTTPSSSPITRKLEPLCAEDIPPLITDGEYMRCPQLNAPCPRAGYTCQAIIGGFYCCPIDLGEVIDETTTTRFSLTIRKISPEQSCPECPRIEIRTALPATTEQAIPKCPFAFHEARVETSDEIKTCIGFLDFSCPFGFTCLPSSTTPTFLCCAQIPKP